jgi:ribosome-binding factor A
VVAEMNRIRKAEIDLKREISFIINTKINDPRIGFITVTDTKLSVDFKWLDVFVSIMGDKDEVEKSLEGLRNSSGFIKKNLQQRLRLRNMPAIRFLHDRSVSNGIRISAILEKLSKDK